VLSAWKAKDLSAEVENTEENQEEVTKTQATAILMLAKKEDVVRTYNER